MEEAYEKELLLLLKKFAFKARYFCNHICFADGLMERIREFISTGNLNYYITNMNSLSYDYDYYAFTKSTKTLHAIWQLYRNNTYYFNEDIFILIRSMFENHVLSRFLRENIDDSDKTQELVKRFISNPLGVNLGEYIKIKGNNVINNEGENLGRLIFGPSKFIVGYEKEYYDEFYSFLCDFTHCSFGTVGSYMDDVQYSYSENKYRLEALLFTIFVFTKIFEGVVTVEGEDLGDRKEEKSYYDLVYNSLELQHKVFTYLIEKYSTLQNENIYIYLYLFDDFDGNKTRFKDMLIKLRDSLFDDIGSLVKEVECEEPLKYRRQYPVHN